ncbi:GIY-YIG nuclease family protein [Methylobacterium fujisawaense]|jgi:hypothetical protein|uniref:GIY-YIG nuclease family protein n=1 Tax=Methylobacterium fujisawaense TaxID=107400 RepID=UPI0031F531F2
MPKFVVYRIGNGLDGKAYIGRTINPHSRWKTHKAYARSGRGFSLHQAMRECGVDNFSFDIIGEFDALDDAKRAEFEAIAAGVTNDPERGYNLTAGGDDQPEIARLAVAFVASRRATDEEAEIARSSARAKKAAVTLGREAVHAKLARARAAIPAEKRTAMGLALVKRLDEAQRRAKAKRANDTLGPEGRSLRAKRAVATLGAEGLSARAKKVVAAQTPEQRSEARRKAWETRRLRSRAAQVK